MSLVCYTKMNQSYFYIGNCVNSFDDDGDGLSHIPYTNVSEFACAEEEYIEIPKDLFLSKCVLNIDVGDLNDCEYLYDKDKDLCVLYNKERDVHYFFED